MATNITQKFSIDLSSVVDSSITATKAIRKANQAQKESEFQKAIADGMSYDDQIALRKKQLEEENKSSFSDSDYVQSLTKSISDTQKLSRFSKYRQKYADTLSELNAGKINEETYLNTLTSTLNGVTDPELRTEIMGDIATAQKAVKTYHDTILDNHVKKAKYDGTTTVINDAINRVKSAKTLATINGNEDEVSAYDLTLSALNSQLTSTKVQDTITNYQVNAATRGTSASSKLNLINNELANADTSTPVKIGDVTYTSAQQYWQTQRDGYLSGNSQLFGDFFKELSTETKNALDADAVKHGYATQPVLDSTIDTFKTLRSKPEIQPYVNKLDITQAAVMADAVDTLAKKIIDVGTNNLSFQDADTQLKAINTKYGVNTDSYRLDLDSKLRQLASSGLVTTAEATKMSPDVQVNLPKIDSQTTTPAPSTPAAPTTTTTTTTPTTTPQTTKDTTNYTVVSGDTLSAIANRSGVTLQQLLESNPTYKNNANLVREGATIVIPKPGVPAGTTTEPSTVTPPAPVAQPQPQPKPEPNTPAPTTTTPPVATPPVTTTPEPKPAVATPTSTATPAPSQQPKVVDYTIVSGDTLSAIAAKNGTTVDALAKLNNIADPNKILAGAKIKLQ